MIPALVATAFIAGPALASNDTRFGEQYGLQKIAAEVAWASSIGTGITIAVVDTGTDLVHKDLVKNVVAGYDFVDNDDDPRDEVAGVDPDDPNCGGNPGHGTHVSGIAAAVFDNGFGIAGVAPDARIMPVRVLGKHGCGNLDDVDAGIRWAADRGAHVINLSLSDNVVFRNVLGGSIESAVEYAWGKGVIAVVAGGNDTLFPSGYRMTNALIVAATDRNDAKASFSNGVGDAKWGISAPGVSILSTLPGNRFASLSGTSMAAPHVAGAAAVLRCLGLTKQQTVDRLLATADDLGLSGKDLEYGSGRLNLAAAVAGKGSCRSTASSTGAVVAPPVTKPGTAKPQSQAGSSGPRPVASSSPKADQVSEATFPEESISPAAIAVKPAVKRRGPGLPEAILALAVVAGLVIGFLRRRSVD